MLIVRLAVCSFCFFFRINTNVRSDAHEVSVNHTDLSLYLMHGMAWLGFFVVLV